MLVERWNINVQINNTDVKTQLLAAWGIEVLLSANINPSFMGFDESINTIRKQGSPFSYTDYKRKHDQTRL